MGGLRKPKRQSPNRYAVEPLRGGPEESYWEPEDWKLSTRILEVAKPLTDKAVDNDQFEAMVRMAALCWNIALLPAEQQEQKLCSLVETTAKGEPEDFAKELKAWGQILLGRKRSSSAMTAGWRWTIPLNEWAAPCVFMSSPASRRIEAKPRSLGVDSWVH